MVNNSLLEVRSFDTISSPNKTIVIYTHNFFNLPLNLFSMNEMKMRRSYYQALIYNCLYKYMLFYRKVSVPIHIPSSLLYKKPLKVRHHCMSSTCGFLRLIAIFILYKYIQFPFDYELDGPQLNQARDCSFETMELKLP